MGLLSTIRATFITTSDVKNPAAQMFGIVRCNACCDWLSDNLPKPDLQMKRLFLLALPARLASTPALAEVDPKIAAQCKDARDFVGCVKAFTTPAALPTDNLTALRNAMKQVAGRLSAGKSLRDSTNTFQPVIDELAVVESPYPDNLNVIQARRASGLFDIVQTTCGHCLAKRQAILVGLLD